MKDSVWARTVGRRDQIHSGASILEKLHASSSKLLSLGFRAPKEFWVRERALEKAKDWELDSIFHQKGTLLSFSSLNITL